MSRAKKIQWIYLTAAIAEKLEHGALAVVEQPGDADEPHVLVTRTVAERIAALDREAIRFWNEDGAGDSE